MIQPSHLLGRGTEALAESVAVEGPHTNQDLGVDIVPHHSKTLQAITQIFVVGPRRPAPASEIPNSKSCHLLGKIWVTDFGTHFEIKSLQLSASGLERRTSSADNFNPRFQVQNCIGFGKSTPAALPGVSRGFGFISYDTFEALLL